MSSFNEQFEAAVKPGPDRKIVGAVVIAADSSGKTIHLDAKGTNSADAEISKPMDVDTTFWMASCTKLLTTIAAMQCVEKGQLDLDADVAEKILPEWKAPKILTGFDQEGQPRYTDATKKITLRQLLTHSSGMGYDFLSPELKKWRESRGEFGRPMGGDITDQYVMPLLFEPGEGWSYSCAIDWAGKMVERVNGNVRLGDYMKTHIWEPLGMTSTGFRLNENETVRKNLCPTTAKTPQGELVPSKPYPNPDPVDDLGGGGLYSCVKDYLKVLVSLLKNDGTLLKPETVKLMFTPQLPDPKWLVETVYSPLGGAMFRAGVESDKWNFGLGGILNAEDVDGVCKKGTMTWGGLPNLFWWIDPAAGNCGLWATQLLPPGNQDAMDLAVAYRKHINAHKST